MKTYTQYQQEIEGLLNVSETVKVTQKIAASYLNLFRSQKIVLDENKLVLEDNLQRFLQFYSGTHPLLQYKENGKKMLIVITGDKGLVGDYYHKIISVLLDQQHNFNEYISIGDKGKSFMQEENIEPSESFPTQDQFSQTDTIGTLTSFIIDKFKQGSYKEIHVLYAKFNSLANQEPVIVKLLPFDFSKEIVGTITLQNDQMLGLPIFENKKKDIFHYLLTKYINIFFYRICLEAKVSELSARILAMEHAKEKTDELTTELFHSYYKDRTMVITEKQLESFIVHKVKH